MAAGQSGFRFGPFRYESEIDLAPLGLPKDEAGLLVRVRCGEPPKLEGLQQLAAAVSAGPAGCVLRVPEVAAFTVIGGNEVWVEEEPGAHATDVRGYLTAWVFGVLCHQNGLLPLHASAVERDGTAAAFCGASGIGKSTLAAYLAGRGCTVLSDDICLLKGGEVVPVASWLKLWRGALDALGKAVDPEQQTFSDEDKYRMRLAKTPPSGCRLRRAVFLERGEAIAIEKLSGTEALARMYNMLYLQYLLEPMGEQQRAFAHCARVLDSAEGVVLRAPWGFDRMAEVASLIETTLLARD